MSPSFGAVKVEETREDCPFGWAPFLFTWKGILAIPNLPKDDMEDFLSMITACLLHLNNLIQHLPWHDAHFWLLEYNSLLGIY